MKEKVIASKEKKHDEGTEEWACFGVWIDKVNGCDCTSQCLLMHKQEKCWHREAHSKNGLPYYLGKEFQKQKWWRGRD